MAIVFDFDMSFVDDNTDTFVPAVVAPNLLTFLKEQYRAGEPWNDTMGAVGRQMQAQGVTREQIEAALTQIPLLDGVVQAVKYAKGKGLKVHILSDANAVFIGTILRYHGIEDLFDSVTTNPARFVKTSEDLPELLEIGPYQPKASPHGCPGLCPINMCKGKALRAMGLAKPGGAEIDSTTPVLYVGDGTGDLCPCLLLTKGDAICAREGHPLLAKLRDPEISSVVRGTVFPWTTGMDIFETIRMFVDTHAVVSETHVTA